MVQRQARWGRRAALAALWCVWCLAPMSARAATYLPRVAGGAVTCAPVSVEGYGALIPEGPPTDRPAEAHADLNLALRGYVRATAPAALIELGGAADPRAPQLATLVGDGRTPALAAAYRVHDWDWGSNQRGAPLASPEVTLLGLRTAPGEPLYLPAAGYDLGGGYAALVLYASDDRLTVKYTREDNVVQGYTLHLENICVEPALLALYSQLDQAGRAQLPALRPGQALGRARSTEVKAAIRDNGSFMDPRSRKDWWQER